jgi:serine-type D-Ala-D-Ala carboxypeptidase/endopeptidase
VRSLPGEAAREVFQPLASAGRLVGLVVGTVVGEERSVWAIGTSGVPARPSLDEDSAFEIGSVTKTFTALLLAESVARGEVGLTDPIGRFLPPDVPTPRRGDREITLLDLATHTARVPRIGRILLLRGLTELSNPYARFSEQDLYRAVANFRIRRGIGTKSRYSNLGFGLLGHVLARAAGTTYEDLLVERVCQPLGLDETRVRLTPEIQAKLVQGHARPGKPVPAWDLPTLAGAGALRSTAADLLLYIWAHLEPAGTPLAHALEEVQLPRVRAGRMSIGLAWHLMSKEGRTVVWHNGGTGGFGSFVAFDRTTRSAVVVLANTRHSLRLDRAAMRLLDRLGG